MEGVGRDLLAPELKLIPQTVYCWGSILERKGLATLTGRAPEICGWALWPCPPPVNSVAGLCGWALFSSWPRPCTLSSLRLGSAAGLRGWALSSSCPPPPLGRAPEVCQLCGWLWLGLVLLLSSSWPRPCSLSTLWLGLVL